MNIEREIWPSSNQKGAAMVEYIVGLSVLMFAIFYVPIQGKTLWQFISEALKISYSSFLYAISIPI